MQISPASRILFQGDSITDCGRDREVSGSLGHGYVNMVAGMLAALSPETGAQCINRGIGGNRTGDLLNRWEKDCLDLKPDVLSIMIGINDVWRRYDQNIPTPLETFRDNYHRILEKAKEALPELQLVLLEPFVLPVPEDRLRWREDLDPKIDAVRHLAREFGAVYVPLDGIFTAASMKQPPAFWAADGVHPTPAGHGVIAKAWLEAAAGVL